MIFQHTLEQVLDGSKSQTRRLVKSFDMAWVDKTNKIVLVDGANNLTQKSLKRWEVGKDYAVQPGRGKHAVERIRITGIRRERVQDISPADAWAELGSISHNALHDKYMAENISDLDVEIGEEYACYIYRWVWNQIHTKKGEQWKDNPEVWVIEFELVSD